MREEHNTLEVVLTLFKRYGIRGVTMDDIAKELGVSKKTIYTEFTDKDDLISRVVDFDLFLNQRLLEKVLESAPDAMEELFMVNREIHSLRSTYSPSFYYDLKKYFPDSYKKWMGEKRRVMYELITQNLQKGKSEGIYRQEIDEDTIGRLYMARLEMLDSNEIIEESDSRSSEFMKEIFLYHLHGICNERGLKKLSRIGDRNDNIQFRQL